MFCPVCNGIQSLQGSCSVCAGTVVDCGRVSDWTGPYAPYEPIGEESLLGNVVLLESNECKHATYCPTCKQTADISVAEWR